MKKIETKSFKTFILDNGGDKTVKILKAGFKGAHAYPRTVPINKMFKLIDKYDFKHPKMIKNRFNYIETEYIDGHTLTMENDPSIMMNLVCNFVYAMSKVDCSPIKKFRVWDNNSEFLEFQVNNMLRIITVNKDTFDKVGLRQTFFDKFKGVKLDDNRKQYLIHCNIEPTNVMFTATDYYLIDWELATYGDLAYELAMHFSVMKYDDNTVTQIIDRISTSLGENKENLVRDVKVYMEFEEVRKAFSAINNVLSNIKMRTTGFDDIIDANYEYYSKLVPTVAKDDLKKKIIMK